MNEYELIKQIKSLSQITVDLHKTIVQSVMTMQMQIEELESWIGRLRNEPQTGDNQNERQA